MDIRDYVTPARVVLTLGIALALTVLAAAALHIAPKNPPWLTPWEWFMDLVSIASLLLTLLILYSLEDIQSRYLLRATLPNLQEEIEDKASTILDLLREGGGQEVDRRVGRELSKADGILKQIQDRTQDLDSELHDTADSIRQDIKDRRGRPQDPEWAYEASERLYSLSVQLRGLMDETKWKR